MPISKLYFVSVVVALFSSAAVLADDSASSGAEFVRKASIANEFEIESSKLALKKTQNADVKAFAQDMLEDHTQTGDKLKALLASSNSELKPEDNLDEKHEKLMDKLHVATDEDFDRQYVSMQLDAHRKAVSLFKSYSENGDNDALKDFASQTLPTLQTHLKHAAALENEE